MTVLTALLAFLGAAALLTITPGLDTALVLRYRVACGPAAAAHAAVGVVLGCLIWGLIVSVGLGGLIATFPLAYTLLKWVGAAYLLWLGINLIVRPSSPLDVPHRNPDAAGGGHALRRGLLTNLLNPKVGIFYLTFLPQFIPAGVNVTFFSMLLAVIHVVLGLLWFAILIAATATIGNFLSRPKVVRTLDRFIGLLFLTFAVKLAATRI